MDWLRIWMFLLVVAANVEAGVQSTALASRDKRDVTSSYPHSCHCSCYGGSCSCRCGSLVARPSEGKYLTSIGSGPSALSEIGYGTETGFRANSAGLRKPPLTERYLKKFTNVEAQRKMNKLFVAQSVGKCVQIQDVECMQAVLGDYKTTAEINKLRNYGKSLYKKGNKAVGSVLQLGGKKLAKALPAVGVGVTIYSLQDTIRNGGSAVDIALDALDVVVSIAQLTLLFVPAISVACPVCGAALVVASVAIELARVAIRAIMSTVNIVNEINDAAMEITVSGFTKFMITLKALFGYTASKDKLEREAQLKKFHRGLADDILEEMEVVECNRKFIPTYQFNAAGELFQILNQDIDLTQTESRYTYQWAVDLVNDGNLKVTIPTTTKQRNTRFLPILVNVVTNAFIYSDKVDGIQPDAKTVKSENAIGFQKPLSYERDLFSLGAGVDQVIAVRSSVFIVGAGTKFYSGSSGDDTFIINPTDDVTKAYLAGLGGTDSLVFYDISSSKTPLVFVTDIEKITGRAGIKDEIVISSCLPEEIDLFGGKSGQSDSIRISRTINELNKQCVNPVETCSIYVHPFTDIIQEIDAEIYYIVGFNDLKLTCSADCHKSTTLIQIYYPRKTIKSRDIYAERIGTHDLICTMEVILNTGENYTYKITYVKLAGTDCPSPVLVQSAPPT